MKIISIAIIFAILVSYASTGKASIVHNCNLSASEDYDVHEDLYSYAIFIGEAKAAMYICNSEYLNYRKIIYPSEAVLSARYQQAGIDEKEKIDNENQGYKIKLRFGFNNTKSICKNIDILIDHLNIRTAQEAGCLSNNQTMEK